MSKRTAVFGVFVVMTLAACVPRFLAGESDPKIEVDARIVNGTVVVTARTDLADGTMVGVQVVQWEEHLKELGRPDADPLAIPTYKYGPEQSGRVKSGSFAVTFDVAGWPPGDGAAIVEFSVDRQPQAVIDRYGAGGERLKGPDVVSGSDGRFVEVTRNIVLPGP